ncbi:hypothetical protein OUZ56_022768 [Daphnia magna]|uniref:Uncharacterized protein n=1 Tax=Daphnia magna TaxID=35525 RepID=A0ABR0AXF1_9CRUS|nr:hypothetical protein OUZ56_022768 [Daphnia magna]
MATMMTRARPCLGCGTDRFNPERLLIALAGDATHHSKRIKSLKSLATLIHNITTVMYLVYNISTPPKPSNSNLKERPCVTMTGVPQSVSLAQDRVLQEACVPPSKPAGIDDGTASWTTPDDVANHRVCSLRVLKSRGIEAARC